MKDSEKLRLKSLAKSASIAPYSLLPADNLWRLMFDVYGDGNENSKKSNVFRLAK